MFSMKSGIFGFWSVFNILDNKVYVLLVYDKLDCVVVIS